ncbi:hypothetical protein H5410_009639 [Solanum commersonii]|uniref:Uncharacterized protein n=1 Tax=Solanum commersonii TaxID=4109 RepID=A0A9J6AIG4_SOLCO|nr:hypothetical protein H5410_009639 [Solanum commersonii]
MWQIREENIEAHEYLMEIPLDKWPVSHDSGKRWGVLTTNLSESFNGVLKKHEVCTSLWLDFHWSKLLKRYTRNDRMEGLARIFVSEHFTIESYVATYSGSFSPIGHEAYWPSPSFTMRSNEFY